ncbi:PQQ-dependent sugar dehydrogenase [Synechococcus sp. PCC 7336]|uniref:PQQ-dependent sugar dehydrogenase n=1 Tax=Synechococcus sp. PCC 7336 TaxID=195250 RepID=UPI000345B5AB|nr:PQQ-dependent sugar dehydrogenase [Synechococcus sp. PCC 7336]
MQIRVRLKFLAALFPITLLLGTPALFGTLAFLGTLAGASNANPVISDTHVPTARGIRAVTVVRGLQHPWSMTWLPDGSILISERPGRLRIVRDGQLDPAPIAGLPPVFARGQGGLLEVSAHPQFEQNRFLYFTYAQGTSRSNRTRLARARFDGKTLSDWQVLFQASPAKPGTQHFGSRLAWLPDGTLLMSIGDGGNPPLQLNGRLIRERAQDLDSRLGKIVRLNDDGSIPADNPFVASPAADPAVWSYGHRNIQGLALDPANGRVWASEHGALGGDELNLAAGGQNFGWPLVSHSREYATGALVSQQQSRPGMADPKLVWLRAIAPSGLAVYRGDRVPEWQGDLFAGGLVAQEVRQIELDAAGNVVQQQSIPIPQRVRDVRQGPDGLLYVLTDAAAGQLLRLEPVAR